MNNVKIGVFSVGFYRYWDQFEGLLEQLEIYREDFERKLKTYNVEVVSAGMVDTTERAYEAGDYFAREQVDMIFCDVVTYVPSCSVLPVMQRGKAPAVLIGLQPTPGMDHTNFSTRLQLEHDNSTSLPEIAYACARANIPVNVVFGMLNNDERAWGKIKEWTETARVLHSLKNSRLGFMGHSFEGMLDMHADPTLLQGHLGLHIEMLEMGDLQQRVEEVSTEQLNSKLQEIRGYFHFPPPGTDPIAGPVSDESLTWSARVAAGLDRLVKDFHLDGFAYYYHGRNAPEYVDLIAGMIVGNSLLTGSGIPVAGECDLKNCVAMLIMDRFGVGGSFAELHPANFDEDFILVGHDGPGHLAISDEKPILRGLSLYHGKSGKGVSVEFKVKTGPITILGLSQTYNGKLKFVVAEGESIPGSIPTSGNTNTRARFTPDMVTFVERWSEAAPTHHFALSVGHNLSKIKKLAKVLNVELDVVCEA